MHLSKVSFSQNSWALNWIHLPIISPTYFLITIKINKIVPLGKNIMNNYFFKIYLLYSLAVDLK